MEGGWGEKSAPAAPEGLVRSIHGPPTVPREPAWPARAAKGLALPAPLGAKRWDVNQSAASAASWLSCPVTSCGPIALPAEAGARLPATRTAAEDNKKRSRRMHPPPEETGRLRAPPSMDTPERLAPKLRQRFSASIHPKVKSAPCRRPPLSLGAC